MNDVILTAKQVKRLNNVIKNEKIFNNSYLTDTSFKETEFIYRTFFRSDDDLLSIMNSSLVIPNRIVSIIEDYTWVAKTNVDYNLYSETIYNLLLNGYAVTSSSVVNSEVITTLVPLDRYVNISDTEHWILTYLEEWDELYILKQNYNPSWIESTLYRVQELPVYTLDNEIRGEKVNLNSLLATASLKELDTEYPEINFIKQVDYNKYDSESLYWISDIEKLYPLIRDLEIENASIKDQLMKHLRAKLIVPSGSLPVDGTGSADIKDLDVLVVEAGEQAPSYLSNQNVLIDKSIERIKDILKQISSIVSIPLEFFGFEAGGNDSAKAKTIRLSAFIKKIEKMRGKQEIFINNIYDIEKALNIINDKEENYILWWDVFPLDSLEILEELSTALESWLITKVKAIMKYQNITEEEALEEYESIQKENASVDVDDLLN